jgi:magnesium transporter
MHALAGVITEKFVASSPEAAAKALESLATHEILLLISPLKATVVVAALNPMNPSKAAAVLRRLPLKQASYILARLEVPQAARLMKEFSTPYRERISSVLEPSFVQVLREASAYAPDSAGALMQTDFLSVRTEVKLAQLIERLKNLPRKKLPSLCLVTDKEGVLKGVIRSAEIAFYSSSSVVGSVMSKTEVLHPQEGAEIVRKTFLRAEAECLPVVTAEGVAVGVLNKSSLPSPADTKKSFWKKLTK